MHSYATDSLHDLGQVISSPDCKVGIMALPCLPEVSQEGLWHF